MSEKAYIDIVFDTDGIGYMQMRSDRRYNIADLATLYRILQFYEDKHKRLFNTRLKSDAACAQDGDDLGDNRCGGPTPVGADAAETPDNTEQ